MQKKNFPVLKIVKKTETHIPLYYKQKFILKYSKPTTEPHRFTQDNRIS